MSFESRHQFSTLDDGVVVQESSTNFESHDRTVTVSADTGETTKIELMETFDPTVEDVQQVIARCADNLRILINRNRS